MKKLTKVEQTAYRWMSKNGIALLRISIGIVFFWFGVQKFFPGLSSAEELASRTIETLSFGLLQKSASMILLGAWEVLIGMTFITGYWMRLAIPLLLLQMIGTIMPLFLYPAETFVPPPLVPTLVGQYIIKNIVIITGAMVVGAYHQGLITIKTKA
ncbi:MAG: DoxX family membrane protein [Bacteroidales bacterium]|nr:DoxX family membrane protein [Bacteroidales bacterium]